MKRIAIALALGVATAAGAQERPADGTYRAFGTDPAWSLTIENGRITFDTDGAARVSIPAPRRAEDEIGWRYETPNLTVHAMDGGCRDEATGRRYAQSVWVTVNGGELGGCGGAELPAGSLVDTAWMISEIAGAEARGPELSIDFHDGGFIAYTGCKRIGGTYSQAGETLVMTITGGTTRQCGQPVAGCERRMVQILARPMKISFPDRRTLVLASEAGAIRLRIPSKDEDIFETRVDPCPALPE